MSKATDTAFNTVNSKKFTQLLHHYIIITYVIQGKISNLMLNLKRSEDFKDMYYNVLSSIATNNL